MGTESYVLHEVISARFEARCVGGDGARYLWHDKIGLKVDPRASTTTLITDPGRLPEGPWFPTQFGEEELKQGAA